jgi:hypothetical protein
MKEWKGLWTDEELMATAKGDLYELVAWVKAENLDAVFEKTNHIDHDWTTNDGVDLASQEPRGYRSSSVGDVFYNANNQVAHVVAPVGFQKVDFAEGQWIPRTA